MWMQLWQRFDRMIGSATESCGESRRGKTDSDENDEISSLVDLLMYMLGDGWKWQDLALVDVDGKILMLALVDHFGCCGYGGGGGGGRIHDDSSYRKDSVDDSILIESVTTFKPMSSQQAAAMVETHELTAAATISLQPNGL
ncbi:hypothetical protein Tco_1354935 [Tanacetum coccineum]